MYYEFIWDTEPGENIDHLADHDLTPEDVEHAFQNVAQRVRNRGSSRKAFFGWTPDDRLIFVAYEEVADGLIHVRTA